MSFYASDHCGAIHFQMNKDIEIKLHLEPDLHCGFWCIQRKPFHVCGSLYFLAEHAEEKM